MPAHFDWHAASATAEGFAKQWAENEPGGAIVGFDDSGIRFSHARGVESLATFAPFSAESVVRYASVTKHFFCAMVLGHDDIIKLDDRLGHHLPELVSPLADVTVGQALDMSGGLPDTRECLSLLGLSVYTDTQAAPLLAFLARLRRLNFDAGSEVSYSNTGYRLVEAALERKGFAFDDFIQNDVAGPLGVTFKAPDVWNDPVASLVPGYWHSGERWQLSAAGLHISASGSLTGSANALTAWLQALMGGHGRYEGLLERLQTTRFLADGRPSGYSLGLRSSTLGERSFVGHGGSHPGYKTYFLLDPESRSGFVVVSNREDTNGNKIALESMAALTGLPLPTPAAEHSRRPLYHRTRSLVAGDQGQRLHLSRCRRHALRRRRRVGFLALGLVADAAAAGGIGACRRGGPCGAAVPARRRPARCAGVSLRSVAVP